ncbi:hypothetical protein MTX25_32965 [Bradyrhizobium sp. ISRA432]|uniref:hypothetical protein n=1 Tax=Bradyrhizobium sp. ISRA430 TaxID=2866192 RepID=UPI002478A734|nr:hypothetical protein [Bradyrhizobium sp. ISRA430]WGR82282.1 hypothetical protein MTX21_18395 [Bradyrhizobium sp. ISRA430]WGR85468.1 hypothetical protein MTX25_32965 [Bradyrhizobium sp. ISRA432]
MDLLDKRHPAVIEEISLRHFAPLFRRQGGITSVTWIEEARVDAARRLREFGHEAGGQSLRIWIY